jgi:RNA polymerase sigma factor for flagellar operon FliA
MEASQTKEEKIIKDLWDRYAKDKSVETRNEIVLNYTWLVKRIVLRFKGRSNNFSQLDDMVNQGFIALIDAVERYNPDLGSKFESFASIKIKGAVIDFMREQDWIPRNQRSLVKEFDEAYGELYAQKGREPKQEEIASRMGISPLHLDKILQQRNNAIILSYEEVIYEKMMLAFPLIHNQRDKGLPESELLYDELKAKLTEAIEELNERERLVVTLYYYENLKLKEIAEVLGVTESRVSQIHSASIIKMKHRLSSY